jgi:hypothetical protein
MRYFEIALSAALKEDDENLLPEKEKRTMKAAEKIGVEQPLTPDEKDEIDQEYYASSKD